MAKKNVGTRKGPKPSRKCRVPLDWNVLSDVQKFNRVFAIYKSVTGGGADGSVVGVNGSVNGVSTKLILDSLRVKGGVVCDLGAADGKFMVCAVIAGAQRVYGVEFAENKGYKMVLDAAVLRMNQEYNIEFNLKWIGGNIEDVRKLSPIPSNFLCSDFDFDKGNTVTTLFSRSFHEFQEIPLRCTPTGTACPQVPRITFWSFVLGLRLWRVSLFSITQIGLQQNLVWPVYSLAVCYMRLMSCNEFSIAVIESLDTFSDHKWILRSTIHTRMYGSSAQHTAWIIDRIRGHRPTRMGNGHAASQGRVIPSSNADHSAAGRCEAFVAVKQSLFLYEPPSRGGGGTATFVTHQRAAPVFSV